MRTTNSSSTFNVFQKKTKNYPLLESTKSSKKNEQRFQQIQNSIKNNLNDTNFANLVSEITACSLCNLAFSFSIFEGTKRGSKKVDERAHLGKLGIKATSFRD